MTEKLPVIATVVDACSTLRFLTPAIARFGWLTVVTMTAQFLLANLLSPAAGDMSSFDLVIIAFLSAFLGLINLPVITSIHRLVLQGAGARAGFAVRREEWQFLWSGFRMLPLLVVMALVIGVAFSLLSAAIASAMKNPALSEVDILAPLQILEAVAITFFASRYFLLFPAAAIGKPLKLRDAAKLLKGNVMRLCVILLPVWITGWLPQLIQRVLAASLPLTSALLGACSSTVSTMLFAVTLSLVFRHLVDGAARDEGIGSDHRDLV
jgi:hypothetical protein